MNKLTIMSSIERTNTVYTHSPINGKQYVRPEKTQSGVKRFSISSAVSDVCKESPSTGDICSVYGSEGSGKCVLMQKNTIKEGGQSGTPHTTESLIFVGL